MPTAFCAGTGQYPDSIASSLQIFTYILRSSSDPPLLQDDQLQFSQPLLKEVLQSLQHLDGPLLNSFQYVQVSLVLGGAELDCAPGTQQC